MKKRSNGEFYFNLYQFFNQNLIEAIIGSKIKTIELEKYFYGQKIDIYAVDIYNNKIFVESMLTPADKRHKDFILKLIKNIDDNSMIIVQAPKIKDEILADIIENIKMSKKNIGFYAIAINQDFINKINNLNKINTLQVVDNIKNIRIDYDIFEIIEKYKVDIKNEIQEKNEIKIINTVEKRNSLLIKAIREKAYFFPTVYREKRCLANRIISYSAGKTDINYSISVEDRSGNAFVAIQFPTSYGCIYKQLKRDRIKIKEQVYNHLEFLDEELIIRAYIAKEHIIYKKIDIIAQTFADFVKYFNKYIFSI